MHDAKEKAAWDRAAAFIIKLHNVNCTEEADLLREADAVALNPYRARGQGSGVRGQSGDRGAVLDTRDPEQLEEFRSFFFAGRE